MSGFNPKDFIISYSNHNMKPSLFFLILPFLFLPVYAQSEIEDVEDEMKQRITDQYFFNTTLMPGIIAALVSGVIAAYLMFFRESIIEPKRWKKNVKQQTLLHQLNAYGKLLAFLDAAEARRKNWKKFSNFIKDRDTHLFLLPGHEIQFNKIFSENMSYFTNEIIDCHKTLVENDEHFNLAEKRWNPDQSSWYQGYDLSEMHNLIKNQFFEMRKKYHEMTGHSFDEL